MVSEESSNKPTSAKKRKKADEDVSSYDVCT